MDKNKIVLGNVDLTKEEHEGKHGKIRITTMIDLEVADALKARAAEINVGYQTLLNKLLHKALFDAPKIDDIQNRLSAIESAILGDSFKTPNVVKRPSPHVGARSELAPGKTIGGRRRTLKQRTKKAVSR